MRLAVFGWDFKDQIVRVFNEKQPASSLFDADKAEYDSLPAGKVKLRFTTNHDHSTEKTPPVEFLSLRGSMAAYVASVFLHGGALIYGSQEVGYPEPINFFKYVPVDWNANPQTYAEYKQLIKIYNENPEVREGNIVPFPHRDVLAFERNLNEDRMLILVNLRDSAITIPTPQPWLNKEAADLRTNSVVALRDSVPLEPFAYFILK